MNLEIKLGGYLAPQGTGYIVSSQGAVQLGGQDPCYNRDDLAKVGGS